MKTREDLKIHIPNSKFFEPNEAALLALTEEEMALIYSDLFEWTEDANWPVAQVLIPLLGRFGKLAVEHFRLTMAKDTNWLDFLMNEFLRQMPLESLKDLEPTLLRLANEPSEYERLLEIDFSAKVILNERLGGKFDL